VLGESDHAADAVLGLHQLEAAVHLVERQPVREKRLDVDLSSEPALDELRHLVGAEAASRLTFASAISGMTVYSANVEVPMK
jgi:ABC-type cobalamin transport system ATPase subunit